MSLSANQLLEARRLAAAFKRSMQHSVQPIMPSINETELLARAILECVPVGPVTFSTAASSGSTGGTHQRTGDDPHDVEGDGLVGTELDGEGDALPYLRHVDAVTRSDMAHILETDPIYNGSWQKRGGEGVFHVGLARKWDRLEHRVKQMGWDIWRAIKEDTRREGVIDDIRDLRRYLVLVEAKAIQLGIAALQTSSKDSVK